MPITSPDKRRILADFVLACFPLLVVLVSIPFAIFYFNQIEFNFDKRVLIPFLVAFVAASLLVFLALRLLGKRRTVIAHGLFLFGLLVAISDVVAPVSWGPLDGASELKEPHRLTAIQLAIAACLLLCWRLLPTSVVRTLGVPIVGVVAITQCIYFVRMLPADIASLPRNTIASHDGGSAQGAGNIYHIVLVTV